MIRNKYTKIRDESAETIIIFGLNFYISLKKIKRKLIIV